MAVITSTRDLFSVTCNLVGQHPRLPDSKVPATCELAIKKRKEKERSLPTQIATLHYSKA